MTLLPIGRNDKSAVSAEVRDRIQGDSENEPNNPAAALGPGCLGVFFSVLEGAAQLPTNTVTLHEHTVGYLVVSNVMRSPSGRRDRNEVERKALSHSSGSTDIPYSVNRQRNS